MAIKKFNISEILKNINLFVFDFDGVIADSVEVKTKAFYDVYIEYGESVASKVVSHHLANGGMSRFDKFRTYHKMFLNLEITSNDLDILCNKFANIVVKRVIDSREIRGSKAFLDYLFYNKKPLVINSATPEEELKDIILQRNLKKYFQDIYGSPNTKTENLLLAMNKYSVSNKEVLFIGDADADFKAANELNVEFLGIGKDIFNMLQHSEDDYFHLIDFGNIFDN